jgi:hypothetical protein
MTPTAKGRRRGSMSPIDSSTRSPRVADNCSAASSEARIRGKILDGGRKG